MKCLLVMVMLCLFHLITLLLYNEKINAKGAETLQLCTLQKHQKIQTFAIF